MGDIPVSVVVPARNEEANIAGAVETLVRQTVTVEVIVVNDASTDRTGRVLADLQQRLPQLRVLEVEGPPPGWTGKAYAVARGAEQARAPWLLLTDADVRHTPSAVEIGLETAHRTGSELVSFSPDQEMRTWCEWAIVPYVYTRLARAYAYEHVSDPNDRLAAANGQWLLVSRRAYDAVGGYAAVKGEVVDDVAFARRVKQAGFRLHFARGPEVARTRMYRRFGEMWEGWSKNLFLLFGRRWSAVATALAVALVDLFTMALPLAALVTLPASRGWNFTFGAAAAAAMWVRVLGYHRALRRNQYPARCIYYYVPGSVLFAALLLHSAFKHGSSGTVRWKGREYAVAGD